MDAVKKRKRENLSRNPHKLLFIPINGSVLLLYVQHFPEQRVQMLWIKSAVWLRAQTCESCSKPSPRVLHKVTWLNAVNSIANRHDTRKTCKRQLFLVSFIKYGKWRDPDRTMGEYCQLFVLWGGLYIAREGKCAFFFCRWCNCLFVVVFLNR